MQNLEHAIGNRKIASKLAVLASLIFAMLGSHLQGQEPGPQFSRWDKNKDGQLSEAELPAPLRRNFKRVDQNQDGFISLTEHNAFVNRRGNNARVPDGVKLIRDVEYVENGHARQMLDLYLPEDHAQALEADQEVQPLPVVLWIHGGGWRGGDRFPCPAAQFAKDGYVVASVGYRLSGSAIFPAQIHDCKSAVRFLKSKSDEYGLDDEHFGAWGSSAGGHLVALLGTSGNADDLEGKVGITGPSSAVHAVCDYYGPTDLLQMQAQSGRNSRMNHDAENSPESLLVGGKLQDHPELAQTASPIPYVDSDDPPYLIVHGDSDPLVPYQQSEMLQEALEKSSVDSELVIVPGGGHGSFQKPEQVARVKKFFDLHLRQK